MATGASDDPEEWLHHATARKLAIWRAYFRLEPWGDDRFGHASTAAMLNGVLSNLAAQAGVEVEMRDIADFMPSDWVHAKPSETKEVITGQSGDMIGNILASSFPTASEREYK